MTTTIENKKGRTKIWLILSLIILIFGILLSLYLNNISHDLTEWDDLFLFDEIDDFVVVGGFFAFGAGFFIWGFYNAPFMNKKFPFKLNNTILDRGWYLGAAVFAGAACFALRDLITLPAEEFVYNLEIEYLGIQWHLAMWLVFSLRALFVSLLLYVLFPIRRFFLRLILTSVIGGLLAYIPLYFLSISSDFGLLMSEAISLGFAALVQYNPWIKETRKTRWGVSSEPDMNQLETD